MLTNVIYNNKRMKMGEVYEVKNEELKGLSKKHYEKAKSVKKMAKKYKNKMMTSKKNK